MKILIILLDLWFIRDFQVRIDLNPENRIRVRELITVDFQNEERHGIYRNIPTSFRGSDLGFRLITADNLEKPGTPVKTVKGWNEVTVRIGDPGATISGIRQYLIEYEVKDVVFDTLGKDCFIWNVTGSGWAVPIEKAECYISLGNLPWPSETKGYTGAYGEKGQNYRVEVDSSSKTIVLQTTKALMPYEGFSVLLNFDGNYFKKPTKAKRILHGILIFWPLYISMFIGIVLYFEWKRKGRDPYTGPVVVQYEPSPDLTASESGTMIDEKVDPRDITAEIMFLILNGYIILESVNHKDYLLRKNKDCDKLLKDHQCELLKRLFKEDYTKGENAVKLSALKEHFYVDFKFLEKEIYKRLTNAGFFSESPLNVRKRYTVIGFLSFFGYLILASILAPKIPTVAFLIPLSAFLTSGLIVFFGNVMVAKTMRGAEVLRYIRGLKEFIRTVEKDRLKRFALDKPEMFKNLLPYAISFGEEEKWVRVFEEIYEELRKTTGVGVINVRGFLPALSYMNSSIYSPPRSSGGGSSGGFSGGGAGGSGGGAW